MAEKKIVVDPGKWDAGFVDCPFADQDCCCGLVSDGSAVMCDILQDRTNCPLNAGPVKVSLAEKEEEKNELAEACYIQHPMLTNEADGFMRFWRRTDCGYGPEINYARVFSAGEIAEKHSIISGEKLAWPKDYIDERAVDGKVKADRCDIAIANAIAGKES